MNIYDHDDIRERIINLFNDSTDSQKKEKILNLQTKFEVTCALLTLANSFPASSIVNNPNMDISNILEGIGKVFKHDQTGINETLQLLAGKRTELYQIMEEIVEELKELEEKDNDIFNIFSLPPRAKFVKIIGTQGEMEDIVTRILESAGIMDNNNKVINQEEVDMLAQAGLNGNMSETLRNLGIDLSEWDEFSQGTIQDVIFGRVAAVSTLKEFTTIISPTEVVPENDPEAEKRRANCIAVVNLLSQEEQSKLANITNESDEKGTTIEDKIIEQLRSSQNYNRIEGLIDINDHTILLQIAGMCYMNPIQNPEIEYATSIKHLKHISDNQLTSVTTNILIQAGIININNKVIDQKKVDMLAQAGLNGNMSETLRNLGIYLSEWDDFSQKRIQDGIFGRVFAHSKLQTSPAITFEPEEEQREKREAIKNIVALLTLKEKSELINNTFDGNEDIRTFLLSVQNVSQIQEILSETEKPEEIMCLISGGCYQSMANELFNNLEPEEKMLLAQGNKIEIKCRSIKNEMAKECIIDMVKTLCKEEMKTLSIGPFCDVLMKLLTKREKIKIAHEGVDIRDILNLEPNSYYQFMFDKLGASEIQKTIYPKCWAYLREHEDDSLIQQYLLVPGKKTLRNLGKGFIDGAKNIFRAVINSFPSKKETNNEVISEISEETPSSKTVFFSSLRTSLKPNPKITVAKDTPLRKFLRRAKAEVKTLFDSALELYYDLRKPDDFDEDREDDY